MKRKNKIIKNVANKLALRNNNAINAYCER